MATSKAYLDFILDQLSLADGITSRKITSITMAKSRCTGVMTATCKNPAQHRKPAAGKEGREIMNQSEKSMFYTAEYLSPVGQLTVASDGGSIVGLWMEGQRYFLDTLPTMPMPKDDLEVFDRARDWLDRYFAGEMPHCGELSLKPIGGTFRQAVWNCLCQIPYGEVTTYGTIAKTVAAELGKEKMSAQAVGGAVGHNPISIIIPCHRVVGTMGNLTGYSGGMDKKLWLLALEGADTKQFFAPGKADTRGI